MSDPDFVPCFPTYVSVCELITHHKLFALYAIARCLVLICLEQRC